MSYRGLLCQIFIMSLFNPLLIKKLEEILKKNSASKSFCSLAQMYYLDGELKKAEDLCLKGLIHHPSFSQAYVLLGEIYKDQGELKKAFHNFNKAKELNPDNSNIYKNLAIIYKKENNIEQTLNAYKMVSFLNPGDPTASAAIKYLEKILYKKLTKNNQKPSQKQDTKAFLSQPPSPKQNKKLVRLNKLLAQVENYIDKK